MKIAGTLVSALAGSAVLLSLAACGGVSVLPVRGVAGNNLQVVSCNSEDLQACRNLAAQRCPLGYRTVNVENPETGNDQLPVRANRSMTIECVGQVAANRDTPSHDDLVRAGVFKTE